jgi:YHS domain-containing protein
MKPRLIVVSLGVALLLAVSGLTTAEDAAQEKEFKATCPVSGKPAVETAVLELPRGGGKVYFCCENCPKAFKADPKRFELKVQRQMLETGQIAQVACPVSGKPVNKEVKAELGQAKVGFCCEKCLAKFNEADDDGKLKLVFAKLDKGFTRQTKCPVSGKPINPEYTVEYKEKKVYFCCPNCPKAFEADPAKFIAKLPQFAKEDAESTAK